MWVAAIVEPLAPVSDAEDPVRHGEALQVERGVQHQAAAEGAGLEHAERLDDGELARAPATRHGGYVDSGDDGVGREATPEPGALGRAGLRAEREQQA